MNFLGLIEAKRNGQALELSQIREIVRAYTAGIIPDYQMAAFLMAVYFRDLNTSETSALTLAIRDSGDVLSFPKDPRPLVDKHSTGGVGDKVSLPLAPLLGCLGFRVPMISGRGLGITGGTLDKLESIPGFQTQLSTTRIIDIVQETGCVICGQTERMVPADKRLYTLRDVTGTVPSIPLIVASILSKKLAEGLDALVLDVKFGAAAFMPTLDKARELARAMVDLGNQCGMRTHALLTNMGQPLGHAAGNWLEVKEAVSCLEGSGPGDLEELVIACAAELLMISGSAKGREAARRQATDCLASGEPRKCWDRMLRAQGADLDAFQRKLAADQTAPVTCEVESRAAGFVSNCDARVIGEVIRDLGGGRLSKESVINHAVGVDRILKIGARVEPGKVLARVHAANASECEAACGRIRTAFEITPQPPAATPPLIIEVVDGQEANLPTVG
jgi:pyrimidine-nucleoside phosphorylase